MAYFQNKSWENIFKCLKIQCHENHNFDNFVTTKKSHPMILVYQSYI